MQAEYQGITLTGEPGELTEALKALRMPEPSIRAPPERKRPQPKRSSQTTYPTADEVTTHIASLPQCEHTISGVMVHFGFPANTNYPDKGPTPAYNAFRSRILVARTNIHRARRKGRWTTTRVHPTAPIVHRYEE